MDQVMLELENELVVPRGREDRRKARNAAPPYLTEEGLVLVDRREGRDRRAVAAAPKPDMPAAVTEEPDLVLERLKRLAEIYGYLPAAGKTGTHS